MDALKNRVGTFTEGILTMGCPVLLAFALKNVNWKSKDNYRCIGDTISLAVSSLITSLFAFMFLVIANMLKRNNHRSLLEFLHRFSMLLVHVCAILQTVLAYMILVIQLKFEESIIPLVVSILSSVFLLWLCIQCWRKGQKHDDNSYAGFEDKLDHSLDALTAVASFFFLTLVGLSLESQDQSHRLSAPLAITFFICVVAVCFMLVGAVPWPIHSGEDDKERKEKCSELCMYFDYMNLLLTIFLTMVLPMLIKSGTELAVGMVCFPWLLVGFVYALCIVNEQGNRPAVIEKGQGSVIDTGDQRDGQTSGSDKDMANQPAGNTEHGSNSHQSGNDNDADKNHPSGSSDDGGNSKAVASGIEGDQVHNSIRQHIQLTRDNKDGGQRQSSNDEKNKNSTGNSDVGDQTTAGNNNQAQPKTVSGVIQSTKPAPMGLTKAIFAGFLAVLIPSLSSSAERYSSIAFIVLTAGVVISGLLWRLLTHPHFCDAPKDALAVASDVACMLTYILVMLAALAFVAMARDALAQDNTTCVTPCTTGQQISNLLRNCHWKLTQFDGQRRSFLLSSVSC